MWARVQGLKRIPPVAILDAEQLSTQHAGQDGHVQRPSISKLLRLLFFWPLRLLFFHVALARDAMRLLMLLWLMIRSAFAHIAAARNAVRLLTLP